MPLFGHVHRHHRRRSTSLDPVVWKMSIIVFVVIVVTAGGCIEAHSMHGEIHRRDVSGDKSKPSFPTVDWNDAAQRTLQEVLASRPNENVARNVIFFLGDGMGVATVTAGRIYSGQLKGQPGEEYQLAFDKFPNVALAKTYNVDRQVADSAGTATAFMCGVKANHGVIGVNQNVRRGVCEDMTDNGVDSIIRWSIREGKRTGIVTTTRITHATPSAGYAHSADRDWESDANVPDSVRYRPLCQDIASQLIANNSDINVIMGGGRKVFLPANNSAVSQNGSRLDGRNLIEEWQSHLQGKSAVYVSNKAQLLAVDEKKTDYLLGLFNDNHMQFRIEQKEGGTPEPSLAEMTEKAIKILRRGSKGYFLLVEGGRIDHGHHMGTAKLALEEVVGFDEAIQRAVDMTDSSDTLIVVTADHSHVVSLSGYPSRGNPILALVDNDGVVKLALDNMPYLSVMYANGPGIANRTNLTGIDTQANWFRQPVNVPLASETHGGEDVAIFASGPMSHLFRGVVEQNYVAHAMAYASCVGSNKAHCASAPLKSAACGLDTIRNKDAIFLQFFLAFIVAVCTTRWRNCFD